MAFVNSVVGVGFAPKWPETIDGRTREKENDEKSYDSLNSRETVWCVRVECNKEEALTKQTIVSHRIEDEMRKLSLSS